MKRFTFKSVLDGLRGSVQQPQRGAEQEIQETLRPDHFNLKKTFRHGFPFSPTAVAWDPIQKLLAIGDKSGSLRIVGRAGVDAHVRHECGEAVLHACFLVNEGALVTATADDVLHLWNFRQKSPQVVRSLKFQRERITCLHLPLQSKWLHVGTERGNVHVVHIESFVLSGYVINWNKAIEVTRANHPGSVVHVSDNPLDASKLLIAFESGLIVVWDLRTRVAEWRAAGGDALRGAAWQNDGKQVMTAHADGALATWTVRGPPRPTALLYPHAKTNKDGKLETTKPIHSLEWKTSKTGESFIIFSGGLPTDKAGRTHSITVMNGKTTTVLEMEHNVVEFITLCESPWAADFHDPYAIVVLLQNDLVVIDLLTPGYPCFENPYPMDLHESPVTCCSYLADCPSDLIPAFYSVGRQCSQKKAGFSEREWPINGGSWSPASCSYNEIILTGHADGSVKFWDASAGTLQILYKLKSSKAFERRGGVASCLPEEENPLAVQLVALCAESRRLAVAIAAAHVVLFKFRKQDMTSETYVLDVPVISDSLDETDSPDSEFLTKTLTGSKTISGQESVDSEKRPPSSNFDLRVRGAQGTGGVRKAAGFQAALVCLQQCPSSAGNITSLTINSSYGLMAYGGEKGVIVVDISRKVVVTALSAASLYGSADPWGRMPNTARRDTVVSEQQRSPSIDQLEEALAELACGSQISPYPNSSGGQTTNVSQDITPINQDSLSAEVDDEAYLSLPQRSGSSSAMAIPQHSSSPQPPSSLPISEGIFSEIINSEERSKIEAAQNRRKSTTWKGFNLKRQLSKVDLKFKNTFSSEKKESEFKDEMGKKGSVFYYSSNEITPSSPVESSLNADIPSTEPHLNNEFTSSSEIISNPSNENKQEDVDKVPELTDFNKNTDVFDRMHQELKEAYGWKEERTTFKKRDDIVEINSMNQSPSKADLRVANRPDNLPLFDEDGKPVRPPRHPKKIKSEKQHDKKERLLSIPNAKVNKQDNYLKDLRKKEASQAPPTFAGNLMRRFRHIRRLCWSISHCKYKCKPRKDKNKSVRMNIGRIDKLDSSFSRSRSSSMSSLENISSEGIQCLAFADSYTKKSDPTMLLPTLWIGTTLGSVLTMMINLPEADCRYTQPVVISIAGGPIFRLKGSILTMSFLDCNGALIPYSYESWKDENKEVKERRERTPTKQGSGSSRMSPTQASSMDSACALGTCADRQFVVIASEKQARVVALPSQNCVYRQQIADTDFVVKAEIISLKDSVCLVNYISTGHLVAYSLPSLRPLINVEFLPLAELRIARTFCFSNKGHGLYLSSPTELQKFTIDAEFCHSLNEMLGELFIPRDMPEPPKEGFFRGLFGGGARPLDREELFGEGSGRPNRLVAKQLSSSVAQTSHAANMENLGQRAGTASSEISRAHQMVLERGDKLGQLEDRTERMANQAQEFGSSAHQLMLKYKDKKWYQL